MKKQSINKIIKMLETILLLDDIELIRYSIESLLDDLKDSKGDIDEAKK